MKQKRLWLLSGPPGSGKSTYASKQPGTWVSRDKIRYSLLNENDHYFDHEDEVYDIFIKQVQEALDNGGDVYADASHLNWPSRQKLLSRLNLEGVKVGVVLFSTPLNQCFQWNDTRTGRANVPHSVIRRMRLCMQHPSKDPFNYFKIKEVSNGNLVDE